MAISRTFTLECRHLRIADNYWFVFLYFLFGFCASIKTQLVNHLPAMQESQVRFLGREDPWRKKW